METSCGWKCQAGILMGMRISKRGERRVPEVISSHRNSRIKQIRALQQRKERDISGLFLVEGLFHIGEALAAGASIEYICFSPELLRGSFAEQIIRDALARGIPCYSATAEAFATLASKEHPQGILAVVRQHRTSLDELSPSNFPWGVAVVAPQDPGNVGAILRTMDAVGASGLILLDGGVDAYHPSAVRASMGAIFWHPVVSASFGEWSEWARQHRYHIFGTSAHAAVDYKAVECYPLPLMLLLGSEREGLAEVHKAVCEQVIRLPMHGRVTSLNLAVAAGVFLYAILEKLAAPTLAGGST